MEHHDRGTRARRTNTHFTLTIRMWDQDPASDEEAPNLSIELAWEVVMKGVTIGDRDQKDVLNFDLKDILQLAGGRAIKSRWKLTRVEASGKQSAEDLHRLCDSGTIVEGQALANLAADVWQVIDGQFEAFDDCAKSPWLVIHAVDSTAYDVQSNDESLLERLRTHFRSVRDLPE